VASPLHWPRTNAEAQEARTTDHASRSAVPSKRQARRTKKSVTADTDSKPETQHRQETADRIRTLYDGAAGEPLALLMCAVRAGIQRREARGGTIRKWRTEGRTPPYGIGYGYAVRGCARVSPDGHRLKRLAASNSTSSSERGRGLLAPSSEHLSTGLYPS